MSEVERELLFALVLGVGLAAAGLCFVLAFRIIRRPPKWNSTEAGLYRSSSDFRKKG